MEAALEKELDFRLRTRHKKGVCGDGASGTPEKGSQSMHNEFTAIIERDGKWFIAYCPEIPGANGQGKTKEEARESLGEAIALILEDRRQEGLRGVRADAVREGACSK